MNNLVGDMSQVDLYTITNLARNAKARADRATPGPWEWDGRTEEKDDDMPDGFFVYHPQGAFLSSTAVCLSETYEGDHLDLDFIAAARTDVPALADAVMALVGVVRQLKSQAAVDVLAERRRQIDEEGWTADHDDEHTKGQLAAAATCYVTGRSLYWPWLRSWWKPTTRRRNLVKAGALILAEIERLDRATAVKKEST